MEISVTFKVAPWISKRLIKVVTKFMTENNEGYNIIMLSLQMKCLKACRDKYKPSKRPTLPSDVADEKNDRRRPRPSGASPRPPRPSGASPHPPRPSGASPRPPFMPLLVSLVCFITIECSTHANQIAVSYHLEEICLISCVSAKVLMLTSEIANLSCFQLFLNAICQNALLINLCEEH